MFTNVEKRMSFGVGASGVRFLLGAVGVLAVALLFHWASGDAFLTPRNLSNLSRQVCVNLTLAVGMTMIILTSGIDLSVGSVMALAGMVGAISQVHWGWDATGVWGAASSFWIAIGVGALCGAVNGLLISRLRITPFIVTLGMMVVGRGLTLILSDAQAVAPLGLSLGKLSSEYLSPNLSLATLLAVFSGYSFFVLRAYFSRQTSGPKSLLKGAGAALATGLLAFVFCGYRGIPYMVFLAVGCVIVGMIALKYLRFGRFLYAIGGNCEAAELSGVPVQRTLFFAYLIMGALAGLAGVLDTSRVNGAVPSAGELAELDAIAAVVIGGTSLMGGAGSLLGTVFGVLVMGILNNGMSLVGISEHYQKVFKGLVIVSAVYLDRRSSSKLR